jgi:hypothetical protein
MTLILSGTDGLSDVDGSAATPAIRGTDANTGIFFGADIIGFAEGGAEVARFNADAQFVAAAGTASLPVITTTGDVNTGIFFPAADTIAFSEGGAEAMRINSSGNVGIGTSSPAYRLSVAGVANTGIASFGGNNNGNLPGTDGDSVLVIGANFGAGFAEVDYFHNNSTFKNTSGGHRFLQRTGASTSADLMWLRENLATFSTGDTERMRIDSSGNVGIGTASPNSAGVSLACTLNASNASTGGIFELNGAGTRYGYLFANASNTVLSSVQSLPLLFSTNNTERMRIDSSGNLLVGTTDNGQSSGAGVKIFPNSWSTTGISIVNAANTNSDLAYRLYSTGAGAYRFYVGYGGTVYATNTTISSLSDQRHKENIRDLDVGLDKIMALKPRLYDWKEGKGADIKNARGFIAQEFETVFPDLIDEWLDPAPEGEEPYKSVRADLIPVLVKAIQEQQALITTLTDRITALEAPTGTQA